MEKNKKRIPIVSIVLIFLGVGLILFGVIFPGVIFGGKNTFSYDTDTRIDGVTYDVEIKTNKVLNEETGIFTVDGEEYNVRFIKADDDHQYEFEIFLAGWDNVVKMNEAEIKLSAKTDSGEKVTFKYNDGFMYGGFKLMATIVPIMFGVMTLIAGLVSAFVLRKSKEIGTSVSKVLVGDGKDLGLIGVAKERIKGPSPKVCEYCGCENFHENTKCTECGAPLKNN